jgi:hypothetical protein
MFSHGYVPLEAAEGNNGCRMLLLIHSGTNALCANQEYPAGSIPKCDEAQGHNSRGRLCTNHLCDSPAHINADMAFISTLTNRTSREESLLIAALINLITLVLARYSQQSIGARQHVLHARYSSLHVDH